MIFTVRPPPVNRNHLQSSLQVCRKTLTVSSDFLLTFVSVASSKQTCSAIIVLGLTKIKKCNGA